MSAGQREVRDGTLSIRVKQDGGAHTLELTGELDLANAGTLESALDGLDGGAKIVLDMRRLEFIDSTGIALLVTTHRRLDGGRLSIVPSEADGVRRVLAVTGLEASLPFAPSADGAGPDGA